MIISICGNAGSGKSTVAQKLAAKLDWPYYNIGDLRRQKAKEQGLTLEEYNKLGETDPSTDLEVDEYQTELAKKEDNFIMEGRTSWHFIPQSFKVFIDVSEEVGASRILNSLRHTNNRNETSRKLESLEEMVGLNRQRKNSDTVRYEQYYHINAFDVSNFDYVLDSTNLSPDQAFAKLWEKVQEVLTKA